MKRLLSFLSNGALMLVYLCAALAVCEAGARFLFKDKGSVVLFPRYHTDYRYGKYHLRGIRSSADFWHTSVDGSWEFRTDSRGFRNEQNYAYGKHSGALRILSIGDSMTQGYEVRQNYTFSAVARRYLKHLGVQAQVINAGVSGYSTEEELAFLENEGYKYQPDVVVLGFYANDFDDNVRSGLFDLDRQGKLIAKRYEYLPGVAIQNVIYRLPGMAWLSRIMINQMYTGGPYPIYQWSDDVQIWQGFPTVQSTDPWYDPPYAAHYTAVRSPPEPIRRRC